MPQKNQSSTNNRSPRKGSQNSRVKRARRRNNKKTRAARKEKILGRAQQKFVLSSCSETYLKALTNPFDPSIDGACIPDLLDLPSAKYRTLARGTMVAGTAGVAFVGISPTALASNSANGIVSTDATYAGTVVAVSGVGVVASAMGQSPFPSSGLGVTADKIQYRIVGVGLRARYIGTELNRGGRIIVARCPNNATTFDNYTAQTLLALRTSITAPVTRRWHSIAWLPSSPADSTFAGTVTTVLGQLPYVIFADSMVAGQGFEWEIVAHMEYVGTLTNLTRSHTDLPGLSAIRDAINVEAEVQEPGPGWYQKTIGWISDNGVSEMSGPAGKLFMDLARKQMGL